MRNTYKGFRDLVIRAIGSSGLHITKRTPPDEVRALIRALRPIESRGELVRLGPAGDGGYLVPNDLDGIEYAFSPGVALESGFEAVLAERGLRVFLADFSVEGPAQSNPNFVFDKKHIGCLSDDKFMTFEEWKTASIGDYNGDLLLQMDIEGGEYESLLACSQALLGQFRIMIIEFHWLQNLFNRPFFDVASRLFRKLLQTHSVVHIHPNNCCGSVKADGLEVPRIAEFTFQRDDRIAHRVYRRDFPHPLDRNNTREATLVLAPCWYE